MKYILMILVLIIVKHQTLCQKKDPLLEHYSIEQIKNMSFEERVNERRRLMNKDTISFKDDRVKCDRYGIKLIEPKNVSARVESINYKVMEIDSMKSSYRVEVFPNSYVDIINRFDRGFYEDAVVRTLRYKEYENLKYYYEDDYDFDVNVYSNNTKRMYYFDESNKLKLIVTETGKNVNEGKEYDWPFPLKYAYTAYYIWNDSLHFSLKVTKGIPFSWNAVEDGYYKKDSTIASRDEYFFYKNNCIKHNESKGNVDRKNWAEDLQRLPESETDCFDNFPVILVRNYIEEYKERHQNNYLKPTTSSVIQPYVIPATNK